MLIFGLATLLEVGIAGAGPPPVFNVLNFGAKGDGFADDTQMEGTLIAPNDPRWWKGIDPSRWLQFQHVGTLNVFGGGIINGRGQNWWKQSCKDNPKPGCTHKAPTAITFEDCNDLWVRDLQSIDSPQVHMLLFNCQRATLSNLKMVAPELSPNTDGIHVQNSQHVYIQNSTMQTGDDCISIGDLVNDVHIDQIVCGPGHGISIGSLGRYGSAASVEGITVRYSNFYGTTNGVRIKTWQGGKGFVRGIRFEHCNFTKVDNPVIIDQYYCDSPSKCPPQKNAVQISNVTYANLYGSSSTPVAAFRKALALISGAGSDTSTMIISEYRTVFVKPISFISPCNSGHVMIASLLETMSMILTSRA
ncbi:probable polygalacturonase At1g80170 [Asparagus officinalis]|uniref:probable polygalacturonase At1g80170 n=1 Tax=Asparagus officinalis TaxID=4686 RepID=UPI00098DFCF5|nr:probable polygalacturonase At1g80170 [Asparagus officinalis]